MNNKRRLVSCTTCKTVRIWILRPWYMDEFWTRLRKLYIFQITRKSLPLFKIRNIFNWEQSIPKVTFNCLTFLIHSIVQIRTFISERRGDWLALVFLALISPSKLFSVLHHPWPENPLAYLKLKTKKEWVRTLFIYFIHSTLISLYMLYS